MWFPTFLLQTKWLLIHKECSNFSFLQSSANTLSWSRILSLWQKILNFVALWHLSVQGNALCPRSERRSHMNKLLSSPNSCSLRGLLPQSSPLKLFPIQAVYPLLLCHFLSFSHYGILATKTIFMSFHLHCLLVTFASAQFILSQ